LPGTGISHGETLVKKGMTMLAFRDRMEIEDSAGDAVRSFFFYGHRPEFHGWGFWQPKHVHITFSAVLQLKTLTTHIRREMVQHTGSYKVKDRSSKQLRHVAFYRRMLPPNSYTPVISIPQATVKLKVESDGRRP
jgi:hypothetical protein